MTEKTNQTVSQAMEQQQNGPSAAVQHYSSIFGSVLPQHVTEKAFVRKAQGLLRRDQNLARVAGSNPNGYINALLDCARLGLDPGETYHFVPFGREIVGVVDYTGEIELIYRAGAVSSIKAEVVYDNDHFHFTPDMDRPEHHPDWFSDRGDMKGVYAYAQMRDGTFSRVVMMNRREVEEVRKTSQAAKKSDSPWQKWPDRMWLKTAIHQLQKWVPTSAEYLQHQLASAAKADAARDTGQTPPPAAPAAASSAPPEVYDAEVVDPDEQAAQEYADEQVRDEAAAEAQ